MQNGSVLTYVTSGGFPRNAAIRQKHSPKRKLILSEAQRGYKIRLSGRIKCGSILPRRESNLLSEVLGVGALALPIAAGGLPPLRPARPAPAQRNQASEYILVLKTWRKRNGGSKRIRHTRENKPKARLDTPQAYPAGVRAASQSPLSVPDKKTNLPRERFVYTSGVRSEKPRVPDLAQCFWS